MNKFKEEKYIINTNKNLNKRICLISDIHHDTDFKKGFYDKLFESIKKTNPDYIAVAGDVLEIGNVLENEESKFIIEDFIKRLGTITKTIIVMGNHDQNYSYHYYKTNKPCYDWFKSLNKYNNVYYLDNDSVTLDNIDFYGYMPSVNWYNNPNKDNFYKEYNRNPLNIKKDNNYKILLLHTPNSITKEINYKNLPDITDNINLILSGHMHNGAMPEFLEFIDFKKKGIGLISPDGKPFPRYVRGVHKLMNVDLVISRGISKFSHPKSIKMFNFIYNKEITVIDLK